MYCSTYWENERVTRGNGDADKNERDKKAIETENVAAMAREIRCRCHTDNYIIYTLLLRMQKGKKIVHCI